MQTGKGVSIDWMAQEDELVIAVDDGVVASDVDVFYWVIIVVVSIQDEFVAIN
jgi:hypothetical protein